MTATASIDAMESALLAIAEADVDVAPLLSARFFDTFPEHRAAFINPDAAWSRMTNETIEAMIGLATDQGWVETSVVNFVDLHTNYGNFPASLYAAYIDMAVDLLAESAGSGWSAEADQAWRLQADRLKQMVAAAIAPIS
jgi:hypothetical protein